MAVGRAETGEAAIRYRLDGPEDAPVACLLHCFGADHRYWDPHMPAFEGFRALRWDARGHGGSGAPPGPWTLEAMAGDLRGLLDALGIARAHVCGVSLGGQVAQTFALAHPGRVASLALVNSTCEYDGAQVEAWRERADAALAGGIAAVHSGLMRRWFTGDAARRRIAGYVYMDGAIRRFAPESFAAAAAAMRMLDTAARLPSIRAPAMVVATPDDPGAPRAVSEKMARLIPDCELHWLEPARHLASLEHPERFNALMRAFLEKVAGR